MSYQPELPLEWPVYTFYQVELRKEEAVVRAHKATTIEGAVGFIDGFREVTESRDQVKWEGTEPNPVGALYGLGPGGVRWEIHVTPDLHTELAK